MFLSDSHPRECAGVVQCVPLCFHHRLARAPFGTEALHRFLEFLRSLAGALGPVCVA